LSTQKNVSDLLAYCSENFRITSRDFSDGSPARTFHVLFGTKTGTQGEEERRFPCEENEAKLLIGAGAGDADEPDTATSPIPATELDISTALSNKPVTTLLPEPLLSLFRPSSGIS
jgi:hypothetical protein